MNDNGMKDTNESLGEAMMNAAAGTEGETKRPTKMRRPLHFSKKNVDDVQDEKLANLANSDDAQDEKIAELTNDLQRTRADFENFRRQSDMQREQHANVVKLATVKKVLPLLDDIDRAIVANPDTLGPLAKNLDKALHNLGLQKIAAEPGMEFSPTIHDAVMVEGDGDKEVIAEELRAGYYYEGEVLRPAMVKVTKQ